MARYLLVSVVYVFFLPVICAGQPSLEKKYVLQDHRIVINGRTNVNKFSCSLEYNSSADTLLVNHLRSSNEISYDHFVLKLPIDQFKCGNAMMNADLRKLLRQKEYPFLYLEIKRIQLTDHNGGQGTYSIDALITIAEVSRNEVFRNSEIEQTGSKHRFFGNHVMLLTEYGLEPPEKFFGTVKVDDKIDLEFEINIDDISE